MKGINSITKGQIDSVVEMLFDRMAFGLLGDIPQLRNKKLAVFSTKPNFNLAQLFISSLNSSPNPNEGEALKNMLSTTYNYIEALKNRTKSRLSEGVDSYIRQQRAAGLAPSESEIKSQILGELQSAGKNFNTIAAAETTKARNMGKVFNIARIGASQSQSDPQVFFTVVRDNITCASCIKLHLMPDKITPRVWKLSEIGFGYGKKSDIAPTLTRHPHCRCSLTYLALDWGFKSGKASFIGLGHSEIDKQRNEG